MTTRSIVLLTLVLGSGGCGDVGAQLGNNELAQAASDDSSQSASAADAPSSDANTGALPAGADPAAADPAQTASSATQTIQPLANGNLFLKFTGVPGVDYAIRASSDLVHWQLIAARIADPDTGEFSFEDTETKSHPIRFYRADALSSLPNELVQLNDGTSIDLVTLASFMLSDPVGLAPTRSGALSSGYTLNTAPGGGGTPGRLPSEQSFTTLDECNLYLDNTTITDEHGRKTMSLLNGFTLYSDPIPDPCYSSEFIFGTQHVERWMCVGYSYDGRFHPRKKFEEDYKSGFAFYDTQAGCERIGYFKGSNLTSWLVYNSVGEHTKIAIESTGRVTEEASISHTEPTFENQYVPTFNPENGLRVWKSYPDFTPNPIHFGPGGGPPEEGEMLYYCVISGEC